MTSELTIRQYVEKSAGRKDANAPDLAAIVEQFARAGAAIALEVRRAALSGALGYSGGENVTGDRQKKLDVMGNEVVLQAFRTSPLVASIVSEEDAKPVPTGSPKGPYVICTDPIDGSSNTDVDGALGTIFSVC